MNKLKQPDEMASSVSVGNPTNDLSLWLSEGGEARRRFLKQALVIGGGAAAANLLLNYHTTAAAQTGAASPVLTESGEAIPVTLRVNGKSYQLKLEPRVTLLDALRERLGLT